MLLPLATLLFSLAPPNTNEAMDRLAATKVLDDFHQAASVADEERYFSHLAPDAEFLGTDPAERWAMVPFRAYVHPLFAAGKGWTYKVVSRAMHYSGELAWFDETLKNEKYGLCRGTGVLRRRGHDWQIVEYSLTFLVPNAVADKVTAQIQAGSSGAH